MPNPTPFPGNDSARDAQTAEALREYLLARGVDVEQFLEQMEEMG